MYIHTLHFFKKKGTMSAICNQLIHLLFLFTFVNMLTQFVYQIT